jgi:hypothetical protein
MQANNYKHDFRNRNQLIQNGPLDRSKYESSYNIIASDKNNEMAVNDPQMRYDAEVKGIVKESNNFRDIPRLDVNSRKANFENVNSRYDRLYNKRIVFGSEGLLTDASARP